MIHGTGTITIKIDQMNRNEGFQSSFFNPSLGPGWVTRTGPRRWIPALNWLVMRYFGRWHLLGVRKWLCRVKMMINQQIQTMINDSWWLMINDSWWLMINLFVLGFFFLTSLCCKYVFNGFIDLCDVVRRSVCSYYQIAMLGEQTWQCQGDMLYQDLQILLFGHFSVISFFFFFFGG